MPIFSTASFSRCSFTTFIHRFSNNEIRRARFWEFNVIAADIGLSGMITKRSLNFMVRTPNSDCFVMRYQVLVAKLIGKKIGFVLAMKPDLKREFVGILVLFQNLDFMAW
jgi:hypothetical protein